LGTDLSKDINLISIGGVVGVVEDLFFPIRPSPSCGHSLVLVGLRMRVSTDTSIEEGTKQRTGAPTAFEEDLIESRVTR